VKISTKVVSPKQQVFLMAGILGILGVSVSVIIIAIGGGFSGPGPSILNPPTAGDLWHVGEGLTSGTQLNYSLTSLGAHTSLLDAKVSLTYAKAASQKDFKVIVRINNGTIFRESTVFLSKEQLTNVGITDEQFRPYYQPIESSILSIRDIAREAKYLTLGAPWDSIIVGVLSVPVKITSQERIKTTAGSFDTFILSYTTGTKTSSIWLAHGIPLPVKAEVYDADDRLQYKYILTGMKR
jgi:hypothetical protein